MLTDIRKTRRQMLRFLFETVLPFVLLTVKLCVMNRTLLETGVFTPVMTAFSLVIVGVLCLFIRLVLRRDHAPFLMTFYCILSAVLLIDAVYCGYTNKLPSVVMLRYTWQLGGVSAAVLENVTLTRILYAIDIPLWILYAVYIKPLLAEPSVPAPADAKPEKKRCRPASPKLNAVFLAVLTAAAALMCVLCCLLTDFLPVYFQSEIISYHVLDIYDSVTKNYIRYEGRGDAPFIDVFPTSAELSPYSGIAADRNVITVQVEALQDFVLGLSYNGQELTPNLNALLAEDTLYFDKYYYQIGGGNTADAEFSANTSLYAPDTQAAYEKYMNDRFYSMPILLKENGYKSATAFHTYQANYWYRDTAYPVLGYDAFLSGDDYYADSEEIAGLGPSDRELFVRGVDYLKTQAQPFYAFFVTLTSHYPYSIDESFLELELLPEDVGSLFGNYLRCVHYVDYAFGEFITSLKDAGLYENSVITIYGDHFALPVYNADCNKRMTKLLGRQYTYAEHFSVPLIMHIPGCGITETCSNVGGHIDIMPTLLHLLGLENEKGVMFGYNILMTEDGSVYEQTHLARGSYFHGNMIYEFPFSGIAMNAKAYTIDTGEGLDASLPEFMALSEKAREAYEDCMYLLDHDLLIKEEKEEGEEEEE